MNSKFSEIKTYAQLRASLDVLSTEIAMARRKTIFWKSLLLPLVRALRQRLSEVR